jgi:superfamily II DNA or RNA helicase
MKSLPNTGIGGYPFINNEHLYHMLSYKKELQPSSSSRLESYQTLVKNYMSPMTRYNSLLLFHPTGSGKSLSAISIAENFIRDKMLTPLVFIKNKYVKTNFISEIEKFGFHPGNYKFTTYSSVKNFENFNKYLVIIDEVHNITGNELYKEFVTTLQKSSQCKLVIMSATPVFNDVLEIFDIFNLLRSVDKDIPELSKKQGIMYTSLPRSLVSEKIPSIKEAYRTILIPYIKGRVSYLKKLPNDKNFAKKEYVTNITPFKKMYVTQMSALQKKIYNENKEKNPGTLYKNLSDISICVFPDGSFGSKGVQKFIMKSRDTSFLNSKNIAMYSPKLKAILDHVNKSEGIVFIYSNYVSTGTKLISALLKENGFSKYPRVSKGKTFLDLSEYKFEEDVKEVEPTRIELLKKELEKKAKKPPKKTSGLSAVNSVENYDGSRIKVIIGTPMVSEGITFKNIRQIHILEPYWNSSRIEQIIGRGIRYKSHEVLPVEKRKVQVFLHCTIENTTKPGNSIDYSKYLVIKEKDKAYQDIVKLIEENSINKITAKKHQKFDESTYFLDIHDREQYNSILNNLVRIFQTGVLHKKAVVYRLLNRFPKDNVEYTLHTMIDNDYIFNNISGKPSRLVETKDLYVVNPVTNDLQEDYHSKL